MTLGNSLLNLLQYASDLSRVDASEVGDGKSSLVEHSIDEVAPCCPVSDSSDISLLAREIPDCEVCHNGVHLTRLHFNRVYLHTVRARNTGLR